MLDLHTLFSGVDHLSPLFEQILIVLGLFALVAKVFDVLEKLKYILIGAQITITVVRFIYKFLRAHPEARKYIYDEFEKIIDRLYNRHKSGYYKKNKTSKETGAAG